MAGVLLARAGVDVLVLEKHADFFRDFRGDTIHPSTLQLMDELGWLDELLQVPHQKADHLTFQFGEVTGVVADFTGLKLRIPYVAFMPQWDFLNFLAARLELSHFRREDGRGGDRPHRGRRARSRRDGDDAARTARGARRSRYRRRRAAFAGSGEIGVCCRGTGRANGCAVVRPAAAAERSRRDDGTLRTGRLLVAIDRRDYWQFGYVIPKGSFDSIRAQGLPQFARPCARSPPIWRIGPSRSTIGRR